MLLLSRAQGISLVSDVSGEQIEALAGGPHLQRLILSQERNDRRSSARSIRNTTQRLASALQQVSHCPVLHCASAFHLCLYHRLSWQDDRLQRWNGMSCMPNLSECPKVPVAIWGVLLQGLPQEQLALSLLVMLAQQRRFISVQTQTGPLKLITELLDRAQESLHLVRRGSSSLNAASGCSNFYPQIEQVQTGCGVWL